MTESTCITYTHESSIDVILTNRKRNFMLSKAVETGLSDFYKMVTTFVCNTYSHQEPIKIYMYHHNYSNFNKMKFIEDFEKSNYYSPKPKKDVNSKYNNILKMIQKVLNKHAPLKSRVIRETRPKKDVNSKHNNILKMIQKVLNKHAPLKSRVIRETRPPL